MVRVGDIRILRLNRYDKNKAKLKKKKKKKKKNQYVCLGGNMLEKLDKFNIFLFLHFYIIEL